MRLRELIFQGIYGFQTAVRLEFPAGVGKVALPPGISHDDLQELLVSLLYAAETPAKLKVEFGSNPTKLALVVEHGGRSYRFVRMSDPSSLRVQQEEGGGWKDVAKGNRVQTFVQRTLGLPDFGLFWCVNLWRFEEEPTSNDALDLNALEPHVKRLVEAYRQVHKAEALDDKVVSLESRIAECQKSQGEGVAIEAKLEKAWAKMTEYEIGDLAEDDVGLIREKEERLAEYRDKLERLTEDEDVEREKIYRSIPDPWVKRPEFWAGLGFSLICIGVSVAMHDTPWRLTAVGNILGLGASAWVLLAYFTGMENASVHQIRLESIKRRLNQVREEQVALQEHLNHLMIHAQVDNSQELTERVAMGAKLRVMIEKMEKRMAALRRDPDFQKRRDELERLTQELGEVKEQRSEYSGDMMSAYQMETDLATFGIDPQEVLEESPSSSMQDAGSAKTALERLLEAAKLGGQYDGTALAEKTRKMWGKIAGHILGERFKDVDVSGGQLRVGALEEAQMQMWRRTRASEERVVLFSLALAVQVNIPGQSKRLFETVVIRDPAETVTSDQAKKLGEVFKSAGRRSDVALLGTDA